MTAASLQTAQQDLQVQQVRPARLALQAQLVHQELLAELLAQRGRLDLSVIQGQLAIQDLAEEQVALVGPVPQVVLGVLGVRVLVAFQAVQRVLLAPQGVRVAQDLWARLALVVQLVQVSTGKVPGLAQQLIHNMMVLAIVVRPLYLTPAVISITSHLQHSGIYGYSKVLLAPLAELVVQAARVAQVVLVQQAQLDPLVLLVLLEQLVLLRFCAPIKLQVVAVMAPYPEPKIVSTASSLSRKVSTSQVR